MCIRDSEEPDPDVFDYWILDTSAPSVFGPFDLEGFRSKKRDLGIPESIILKPVNSFRNEEAEQAVGGNGGQAH